MRARVKMMSVIGIPDSYDYYGENTQVEARLQTEWTLLGRPLLSPDPQPMEVDRQSILLSLTT